MLNIPQKLKFGLSSQESGVINVGGKQENMSPYIGKKRLPTRNLDVQKSGSFLISVKSVATVDTFADM